MWFKNLVVYQLPADWNWSAAALEEALSRRELRPCGTLEMSSKGWVAPSGAARLLHTVEQQHLIALGMDQKVLPATIIRQEAARRAQELADRQGFPAGRRQLRELKLRVTEELCARALCRQSMIRAWIDPAGGWLIIDSASTTRAEELIETLRDTLGSLAVQLVDTQRSPHTSMAAWLAHEQAPAPFTLDQDLELQSADAAKATIRYTRHPLDGREIRTHLAAGKYPTRLGLTWKNRVSFLLTDKLQIKSLAFLEMTPESTDTSESQDIDPAEQFDIDFTVMAGELAKLLRDLVETLGGPAARETVAAAA